MESHDDDRAAARHNARSFAKHDRRVIDVGENSEQTGRVERAVVERQLGRVSLHQPDAELSRAS
jgi:hypothetical protein